MKYTIITGASTGLGRFLAIECARRKFNLVLVALPDTGLKQLTSHLISYYSIQVIYFELDLTLEENCYCLFASIEQKGLQIDKLINNAGIGGTFLFDDREFGFYRKMVALNVTAPTILSRLFLNKLAANPPAYILNVSSLAGLMHLPRKQVYGATKSYLISFSMSLRKELKKRQVKVAVLCPGGMNTTWRLTLANKCLSNWLARSSVMEPADVAKIAIQQMLEGRRLILPGSLNRFFLFMDKLLPERLKEILQQRQLKNMGSRIVENNSSTVGEAYPLGTAVAV